MRWVVVVGRWVFVGQSLGRASAVYMRYICPKDLCTIYNTSLIWTNNSVWVILNEMRCVHRRRGGVVKSNLLFRKVWYNICIVCLTPRINRWKRTPRVAKGRVKQERVIERKTKKHKIVETDQKTWEKSVISSMFRYLIEERLMERSWYMSEWGMLVS